MISCQDYKDRKGSKLALSTKLCVMTQHLWDKSNKNTNLMVNFSSTLCQSRLKRKLKKLLFFMTIFYNFVVRRHKVTEWQWVARHKWWKDQFNPVYLGWTTCLKWQHSFLCQVWCRHRLNSFLCKVWCRRFKYNKWTTIDCNKKVWFNQHKLNQNRWKRRNLLVVRYNDPMTMRMRMIISNRNNRQFLNVWSQISSSNFKILRTSKTYTIKIHPLLQTWLLLKLLKGTGLNPP